MDISLVFKALILGIVEGLTEFLPISSTGHLIIAGSLLDYTNEQSKVFKIVIQLGAILAVVWHYRARLSSMCCGLAHNPREQRFAALLLVGFLPAAVLGVLFHSLIKNYLFNPITVAFALIAGGVFILWVERKKISPRVEKLDDLSWKDALKVGFAQSAAMFPGVSRSGATIMGGLLFGLSRKTATEFSFFLAIPTLLGATVFDVAKNWHLLHFADFPVFAVGFLASFISAMLTVKALLRYVASHDFTLFAWYRIVFGALVLLSAWNGWVLWQDH